MNFTNYEEMAAMILFGIGFTTLLLHKNMIKKIIGFSMMDSAIYLFLAVKGYIAGRKAPIVVDGITSMEAYINPIPAGLVLTGFALDRLLDRLHDGADARADRPALSAVSHAGY